MVEPGPALDEHLDAIDAELSAGGGLDGVVLTHDHFDHAEAVPAMRERRPGVTVAAARGKVEVRAADGVVIGPFEALAVRPSARRGSASPSERFTQRRRPGLPSPR